MIGYHAVTASRDSRFYTPFAAIKFLNQSDVAGEVQAEDEAGNKVTVFVRHPDGAWEIVEPKEDSTANPQDPANQRYNTVHNPSGPGGGQFGQGNGAVTASGGSTTQTTQGQVFTEQEYAAHIAEVQKKVSEAVANHETSEDVYREKLADGSLGPWDPKRYAQQQEILDEFMAKAANVPNNGEALVAGGLGGAGKGYVLKNFAGIDQNQFLTVNPDDIKEAMATKGMIPKVEGLSPMEASPLVHEEASQMGLRLANMAYDQKKNVIWDVTMGSESSIQKRIDSMREAGYNTVDSVFVDVDLNTSMARAQKRHRGGEERYRNGQGNGGRVLPVSVSLKNGPSPGSKYRSKNREVFEKMKGQFDSWVVYNAMTPQPVIESSGGKRWLGGSKK
jgi:predicted ABC-type ATPase